eukprot:TRINITY_DN18857_c0_g1_i1.p1 TRINITY_DN18857_c0_g1~~TRINITY_DN18857_c0_g1_i1.p1  ORF type:complete len:107 (-),score=25.25 TRINITY_DN18857_c0_g1_i1:627-947(-)
MRKDSGSEFPDSRLRLSADAGGAAAAAAAAAAPVAAATRLRCCSVAAATALQSTGEVMLDLACRPPLRHVRTTGLARIAPGRRQLVPGTLAHQQRLRAHLSTSRAS